MNGGARVLCTALFLLVCVCPPPFWYIINVVGVFGLLVSAVLLASLTTMRIYSICILSRLPRRIYSIVVACCASDFLFGVVLTVGMWPISMMYMYVYGELEPPPPHLIMVGLFPCGFCFSYTDSCWGRVLSYHIVQTCTRNIVCTKISCFCLAYVCMYWSMCIYVCTLYTPEYHLQSMGNGSVLYELHFWAHSGGTICCPINY